jgi:LysM repeat protein
MSLLDLKRRSASAVQRPTGKTALYSENSESSKKQKPIAETKSYVFFSIFKNLFLILNYFRESAGRSGNLRIKICLSDGQTDVMEFSSDVNTSTFLSLISQKFNVPVSTLAQIRSGHPPKVMDQTKSNSPVEFSNGDRVQITLGPASATTSISAPMPSSGAR